MIHIFELSIETGSAQNAYGFLVIEAKDCNGDLVSVTKIYFHNGNSCKCEEGLMEADDDTIYDTSELYDFINELLSTIYELSPYLAKAEAYAYENK